MSGKPSEISNQFSPESVLLYTCPSSSPYRYPEKVTYRLFTSSLDAKTLVTHRFGNASEIFVQLAPPSLVSQTFPSSVPATITLLFIGETSMLVTVPKSRFPA